VSWCGAGRVSDTTAAAAAALPKKMRVVLPQEVRLQCSL
jgi:hypothetical protein